MFLSEESWITYTTIRMPVRYISKIKTKSCQICGNLPELNNPLQNAHIIGFNMGIKKLGLSPVFLDGDDNIISAHRKICNKKAELSYEASVDLIKNKYNQELPNYIKKAAD